MADAAIPLAPPRASILRQPGLPADAPGSRRLVVAGQGVTMAPVRAGDTVVLTNREGGQRGEVTLVDTQGRFAPAGLGLSPETPRCVLDMLADAAHADVRRVRDALTRRGVALASIEGHACFSPTSPAGEQIEFTVQHDGLLLVGAPAPDMAVDLTDTATPIDVHITRAAADAGPTPLPEPLAVPLQDIRIAAGTAQAYVVKAGQYIQVIDVEGRQCSDFQAFALDKVQRGLDRGLDATVTRTLLGRSYPTPGLPSKAFDRDCTPLIEFVQDTVGRHDAFATACGPRYYDDMGYPGHVNCSENFNLALAPYGVAPRPAWEAMNFFYNTALDEHEQLHLDEPWSRPGDYVLMRALTDLLCVSSSCPDDIDPANGWEPTDIHIRTYDAALQFPRAMAHRMTPDAEPRMTRETPFHPATSALTTHYTDYRGQWLPTRFLNEGPVAEYWACREGVAVMDLSALRKFEITGPDAEPLLQWCMTRDIGKLSVGQIVYTAICHPHGGMMDDGTVFRMGPDSFRLVCGEDVTGIWLREQAQKMGYRAWVRSSTDQLCNLAVQGPNSRELLSQILWTAPAQPTIEQLQWFRFAPARIGGFEGEPVVVSRTGYTGELGFEVFCHPRHAQRVFDAIWQAGQPLGLKPLGLDALDMLRIEAGLVFAGYEFCDQTDPFEAGIGFTVPLKTKACDFVGRDALVRRKAAPRGVLVGLALEANEVAAHGDGVYVGRAQVGVVTSGMYSPILQRSIALARVDAHYAELGTALEVGKLDGQQKRLPAQVVRFPHYDPDKLRVKS